MILGEKSLISMTDTGKVRFIKRLDFTAVCFISFVVGWYWEPNARLITAVVSEHGSVLIYEEAKLIWTLQLNGNDIPVAIQRSNIQDLPGAMVLLSDTGLVSVGYLGSEPYPFQVPALNMQRMNVEAAHDELVDLEKEIRTGLDFSDSLLITTACERDLLVKITRMPTLQMAVVGRDSKLGTLESSDLKKCMISVNFESKIKLDQMQVYFDVSPPLQCSKPTTVFRQLNAMSTGRAETWIFVANEGPLSCLEVKVIVSFINTQSICRVIEKSVLLPLNMFFKPTSPVKEDASVKVTMALNGLTGPMPTLASLLSDDFAIDTQTQAIGLRSIYVPDTVVTIVAAKNSNRFRLQSTDVTGLPLVFSALRQSFKEAEIKVTPQLPISPIISTIDKFLSARNTLNDSLVIF